MVTPDRAPAESAPDVPDGPFGTTFAPWLGQLRYDATWGEPTVVPVGPLELHPGSHVLHYGSQCFEGLKAHRDPDGAVQVFRLHRHMRRMRASCETIGLPVPPEDLLVDLVTRTVAANHAEVPAQPGSLYLRPTAIGVEANIGAAANPSSAALVYVLASPVGDYFSGGLRPLRIVIEQDTARTVSRFGTVKTGANYAMALGPTLAARKAHDADQVLFAPGGAVQETGASNIALVTGERLVTPRVDGTFLEGVTRDTLLQIARDLGLDVEERDLTVEEVLAWSRDGEVVLTGTAAVVAPVGTFVVDGSEVQVRDGAVGPAATRLREALLAVQRGEVEDRHGWRTRVEPA